MKLLIGFALSLMILEAAQPLKIPAAAVQAADGYHYTDPQGKQWLYRQTPFGVARLEEPAPVKAASPDDGTRAAGDGDVIRFERPSPFGTYRWTRKKSELTESERAVWNRDRSRTATRED